MAQAVKCLTCARLVPSSNLDRDTDYPKSRFCLSLGTAGECLGSVLECATQYFFQLIIHHYERYPIPSHGRIVK
jgi:hypothetical protein